MNRVREFVFETASTEDRVEYLSVHLLKAASVGRTIARLCIQMGVTPMLTATMCDILKKSIFKNFEGIDTTNNLMAPAVETGVNSGLLDIAKHVMDGTVFEEDALVDIVNAKFDTGELDVTDAAVNKIPDGRLQECVNMHRTGNWGPFMSEEDIKGNNTNAAKTTGTIFSIHRIHEERQDDDIDNKLYIITEADRSKTTVMLPEEY